MMLYITVPLTPEGWDDEKQEFIKPQEITLQLEHSLVSISKWESKWCKSFIASSKKLTDEEILDYVKCMTLNKNVPSDVYDKLTQYNVDAIEKYISAPMTATYFSDSKNAKTSRETVTSELIYYWMIALNIPFECQKWHLNRLLTLIRVCNIKNQPPKKMNKRDIMRRNSALNAARRKQFNTKG